MAYKSSRLNLYDSTNFTQLFEIKNEENKVSFNSIGANQFNASSVSFYNKDSQGAVVSSVIDAVSVINANVSAINDEIAARAASDTNLQTQISNEVSTRTSETIALELKIESETNARTTSDNNLQSQINNLSATITSGVHWRASVDTLADLQALYATDSIGDVRLVKSERDAYIKVEAGTGEFILNLDGTATPGVGQLSYVRFMDSAEVVSGIQNANVERLNGDNALQAQITQLSADLAALTAVVDSLIPGPGRGGQ